MPMPEDDYFNDLSRQPGHRVNGDAESPPDRNDNSNDGGDGGVMKPKRIACVICRKRKLRCDGDKPSCGTCARLGHSCAYDEIRRKSGPKRGYVKELEARLAQVETQLKTKDQKRPGLNDGRVYSSNGAGMPTVSGAGVGMSQDTMNGLFDPTRDFSDPPSQQAPSMMSGGGIDLGLGDALSWEMIGLGLEEPLPPQETIDELHQIYFEKIHPSIPMMHKYRYLASMNLAPHMRPPICLRYAMWCLASSVTDKYFGLHEIFYYRARKYAENDEMKGHGETFITIGHAQCWILISTYEFKMMYFPRAWISVGKAVRLAQMMGLHRLDGAGLEVKQSLPPPRDWTDREERRRTFWLAYCEDRYASIGTGWPMVIDDRDILTNLPSTEEAFERSKPQRTLSLSESMTPDGAAMLSSFAGVVLMACLFGRNLTHLHRPDPNDQDDDVQGEFWKRHRNMDNILLNTSLSLPPHLRLPAGVRDANIVFLNMNIHTSTICLHQAAIFKAERNNLPEAMIDKSRTRCILAAAEIANIMRLASHLDLTFMNPFTAFCLYVSARVFVQFLKKVPDDQEVRTSLDFLLNAMHALKRKHPLTESFLAQLIVDMEGNGLDTSCGGPKLAFPGQANTPTPAFDSFVPQPTQFLPGVRFGDSPEAPSNNRPLQTTNGKPLNMGSQSTSQYSLSTFDLVAREQRQPRVLHYPPTPGGKCESLLPDSRWSPFTQRSSNTNFGPFAAFDTEMSDHASDERHSTSNEPTPSTSHQASSHTSYSPPHEEDEIPDNHHSLQQSSGSTAPMTAFYSSAPFPGFNPPPEANFPSPSPGREDHNNFTLPSGWEVGSSGVALGSTTGFSPLGEGGWTQMLDGMGWDGAALGAGDMALQRQVDDNLVERKKASEADLRSNLEDLTGASGW